MTRFGVMKHLHVLEEAHLVVTERSGRSKLHYLNPVPIREIHDRWISRYAEPFVAGLLALRDQAEHGRPEQEHDHGRRPRLRDLHPRPARDGLERVDRPRVHDRSTSTAHASSRRSSRARPTSAGSSKQDRPAADGTIEVFEPPVATGLHVARRCTTPRWQRSRRAASSGHCAGDRGRRGDACDDAPRRSRA